MWAIVLFWYQLNLAEVWPLGFPLCCFPTTQTHVHEKDAGSQDQGRPGHTEQRYYGCQPQAKCRSAWLGLTQRNKNTFIFSQRRSELNLVSCMRGLEGIFWGHLSLNWTSYRFVTTFMTSTMHSSRFFTSCSRPALCLLSFKDSRERSTFIPSWRLAFIPLY